jgi:hypothetical protein
MRASGHGRLPAEAALVLCTLSACVFWDTGTWSTDFVEPTNEGGPSTPTRPVTLASSVTAPWSIAVDSVSGFVFYTSAVEDGGVYTCALTQAGCKEQETLVANQAGPWSLAVIGGAPIGAVYWANAYGGTIQACQEGACPLPTTIASGQGTPEGVAVFAGNIFWTGSGDPGAILYCPLAECSATGPITVAGQESDPTAIAVDATGVYWGTSNPFENNAGEVRFCNLQCSQPTTLAKIPSGTESVALYNGAVYWSSMGKGGAITSCSEANCQPTTIAPAQSARIAVDSTGIYWAEGVQDGSVSMCPTAGCGAEGPRVLATLVEGVPYAIALDANYVYFSDTTNSAILRVPKPMQ